MNNRITTTRRVFVASVSIVATLLCLSTAWGQNGVSKRLAIAVGDSFTISTKVQTATRVTLTLPPPLKPPPGEPGSKYTEELVRTFDVIAMSNGQVTKLQLAFSKIDQKMSETGLDGATRNSQGKSGVPMDKKFVVLCEPGKEAVDSVAGNVSPEERALSLRECSVANGLLSAFEVLDATRTAKDSRKISLDQASALMGGAVLKGKIASVVSFDRENSDGGHSFKLSINEDGGDSDNGTWHGTIVQSQDYNHIETNAEGTNKAIQGLGKSKLESASTTTLVCVHDFKLRAK